MWLARREDHQRHCQLVKRRTPPLTLQMVQDIERNEEVFQFAQEEDVYSIAVVLKQYLRELPEPLFPLPLAERVKYTENRGESDRIGPAVNSSEQHISNSFAILRGRLRRLPPIHQTTFQAILEHLTRVASHLADNKMDPKNLAVVFNSVLFGPEQVTASANPLTMHLEKDSVLEDLITYSDIVRMTGLLLADPSSSERRLLPQWRRPVARSRGQEVATPS